MADSVRKPSKKGKAKARFIVRDDEGTVLIDEALFKEKVFCDSCGFLIDGDLCDCFGMSWEAPAKPATTRGCHYYRIDHVEEADRDG